MNLLSRDFTAVERVMLDRAQERHSMLCREEIALPWWRFMKRAKLRDERCVAGEALSLLYKQVESDTRDRLLTRMAGCRVDLPCPACRGAGGYGAYNVCSMCGGHGVI